MRCYSRAARIVVFFATVACRSSTRGPPPAAVASKSAPCGFPAGTRLDFAIVKLRVFVQPDGKPARVEVISAPEPAFAEHARRCALARTFSPARNATGEPIAAFTPPFSVFFRR